MLDCAGKFSSFLIQRSVMKYFIFLLLACTARYGRINCSQAIGIKIHSSETAEQTIKMSHEASEIDQELLEAINTRDTLLKKFDTNCSLQSSVIRISKALDAGANPNIKDNQGVPVLMRALYLTTPIQNDYPSASQIYLPYTIAEELLHLFFKTKQIELDATDSQGNTALIKVAQLIRAYRKKSWGDIDFREHAKTTITLALNIIACSGSHTHKNQKGESYNSIIESSNKEEQARYTMSAENARAAANAEACFLC
jgi:hypothetical protein